MKHQRRYSAVVVALLASVAFCCSPALNAKDSSAAGGEGDACALISDAEIGAIFPGAQPGRVDRSKERYGVIACGWDYRGGRLSVQLYRRPLGPWSEEGRGMIASFVDPVKPGALNTVRFEPVAGIGDRAMAVVERRNDELGIVMDIAQLMVQVGPRQARLYSSELPKRERPEALKVLGELGRAVARRL